MSDLDDLEGPLWSPEIIDRCRTIGYPQRRRWRLIAEALEPVRVVRLDLSLWTARTSGQRPPGDDDELIAEIVVAERWVAGVGVHVPPSWSRWLVDRGVVRQ